MEPGLERRRADTRRFRNQERLKEKNDFAKKRFQKKMKKAESK